VSHDCKPPDPKIYHVMGEVASKLSPGELLSIGIVHSAFLSPGDTWRCECGRRWLFTPRGWRRRYSLYVFMAYGKEWTPKWLGQWEEVRARVADR
jgi:hypothetical protein